MQNRQFSLERLKSFWKHCKPRDSCIGLSFHLRAQVPFIFFVLFFPVRFCFSQQSSSIHLSNRRCFLHLLLLLRLLRQRLIILLLLFPLLWALSPEHHCNSTSPHLISSHLFSWHPILTLHWYGIKKRLSIEQWTMNMDIHCERLSLNSHRLEICIAKLRSWSIS